MESSVDMDLCVADCLSCFYRLLARYFEMALTFNLGTSYLFCLEALLRL